MFDGGDVERGAGEQRAGEHAYQFQPLNRHEAKRTPCAALTSDSPKVHARSWTAAQSSKLRNPNRVTASDSPRFFASVRNGRDGFFNRPRHPFSTEPWGTSFSPVTGRHRSIDRPVVSKDIAESQREHRECLGDPVRSTDNQHVGIERASRASRSIRPRRQRRRLAVTDQGINFERFTHCWELNR
jgi:hypothetical protein